MSCNLSWRKRSHNDVAGFIYAALGVIYAVLLALVVIAVWEEYNAASETVEQEANALAEIYWLGNRLPESEGTHIQELAQSYAEEVIHKEWPLMEQGEAPLMTQVEETPTGWTLIDDIRASLQEVEPRTKADEQLYSEGLDQVQRLADARRMRLGAAEEGSTVANPKSPNHRLHPNSTWPRMLTNGRDPRGT